MKKLSIAIACGLMLAQLNAFAFEAVATVVAVSPIMQQVNQPSQQCWTETQPVTQAAPQQHNYVGAIVGGVAGGLLAPKWVAATVESPAQRSGPESAPWPETLWQIAPMARLRP